MNYKKLKNIMIPRGTVGFCRLTFVLALFQRFFLIVSCLSLVVPMRGCSRNVELMKIFEVKAMTVMI